MMLLGWESTVVIQVYCKSQQGLRGKLELRGEETQVSHPLYETLQHNILMCSQLNLSFWVTLSNLVYLVFTVFLLLLSPR